MYVYTDMSYVPNCTLRKADPFTASDAITLHLCILLNVCKPMVLHSRILGLRVP